jgi:hypothetical protein
MVLIRSYYIGRTANFATSYGFYLVHYIDFEYGLDLHLMITRALIYLIGVTYTIFALSHTLAIIDSSGRNILY